jgi:hypothetical protein
LFFPVEEEEKGKYFEFQGIRSLNAFEKFVFEGEYLTTSVQAEQIPDHLEGFELYSREFL